jgi:vacuolar-type H+-ATPase subunit B/Vma2
VLTADGEASRPEERGKAEGQSYNPTLRESPKEFTHTTIRAKTKAKQKTKTKVTSREL